MKRFALLLLLVTACSRGEEPAADNAQQPATTDAPASVENESAATAIDPKSPEAAIAVLREYFRLIGEKRFIEAHRLWSTDPQATDLSDGAFAESFSRYRTYRGKVGKPGPMEGAAGSTYIEVPVEVSGHFTTGNPFHENGMLTLRRVNDVPGATAEQLQWRIYRSELKNEVAAGYRFVGRWATVVAKCSAPWRFTETSLKTPAGAACSFVKVTEMPGGYDIAASCTAESAPKDDTLKLRFAESAKALLLESRVVGDAGLVRCR